LFFVQLFGLFFSSPTQMEYYNFVLILDDDRIDLTKRGMGLLHGV
jgi:hypothetical protein